MSISSQSIDFEQEAPQQQVPEDPIIFQETKTNQQFEMAKEGNLLDQLQIHFEPLYNPIEIGQGKSLPVVLQINALKTGAEKVNRSAIDLVCVVDNSGSMSGEKLKLVQNSLRYLTKILNDEDRISIVSFQSYSKVEIGWTRNNVENKKKIKKAIKSIRANGGTNIASGMHQALSLMANRQQKNPVTCLFLLSDGQDGQAIKNMKTKGCDLNQEFAIHTFGYGEDHDPKVMDEIATLKQGSFSFIKNIEKAADHFILALSGFLSIYASNAVVQIQALAPFQIKKFYGDENIWVDGKMNLNYLIVGQDKQFVMELLIPDEKQNALETVAVLTARITGKHTKSEVDLVKETFLEITVSKEGGQLNEFVFVNYLRAKGGEAIGLAKDLASSAKYQEAIQLLDKALQDIDDCPYKDSKELCFIRNDLIASKTACKPQEFQKQGLAVLMNNMRHHGVFRQRSVSNAGSWNSDQEAEMSNFKKGNMHLSSSSDSDDEQLVQRKSPQLVNRRKSVEKNRGRKFRRQSSENSDSGSGNKKSLPRNRKYSDRSVS